jgi:mevalonate kinase
VGDPFAIVKGALALAGFHPRFRAGAPLPSLAAQLQALGGGLELSLLAAVPKGSGLGTSSILAATALGTLSDVCALGWSQEEIIRRTLVLEQLLTTGGGWQDQAGGIWPGLKLIETAPGLDQSPVARWLPDTLLAAPHANHSILLYYSGITRVAKDILQEIVRGMFLNARDHLEVVREIARHAQRAAEVVQRRDLPGLAAAVAHSWQLNQRLDAGTNPPAVAAILDPIGDWLLGAKLLGAGGGGYILMFAKDPEARAPPAPPSGAAPTQHPRPLRRLPGLGHRPADHPQLGGASPSPSRMRPVPVPVPVPAIFALISARTWPPARRSRSARSA